MSTIGGWRTEKPLLPLRFDILKEIETESERARDRERNSTDEIRKQLTCGGESETTSEVRSFSVGYIRGAHVMLVPDPLQWNSFIWDG